MLAFEGEIWVRPGTILPRGRLLADEGRILAVGEDIEIPEGVIIRKLEPGQKLLPGFVEPHCHLGLYEEITGADRLCEPGSPLTPERSALEHIRFDDVGLIEAALSGGVTTACILPGSASLIGGLGSIIKTGGRRSVLKEDCFLKIALGENVEKENQLDRKAQGELLRSVFREPATPSITAALEGRLPVRVHCHAEEDIRTALELKREFGLALTLEHATEAWKCLPAIREAGVPVIAGPFFVGRPKKEMASPDRALVRKLLEADIPCSFMTDYPSNPPEMLRNALLEAIRWGAGETEAYGLITTASAALLGVGERVGSLEPGKDADLVVHSHSPFDSRDRIMEVYIKGEQLIWPGTY